MALRRLYPHQQRMVGMRHAEAAAQVAPLVGQQGGGHLGIGHRPVGPAGVGQPVQPGQRAQFVAGGLGCSRRDSRRVQTKEEGWCAAGTPARSSSAVQKRRSNDALCATRGVSPTTRAASAITGAAGGAAATIALLMPVNDSMNAEMRTPAFIRRWNRSTTRSPSSSTIATSVARSPIRGERPVVSKSMTAVRGMRGW